MIEKILRLGRRWRREQRLRQKFEAQFSDFIRLSDGRFALDREDMFPCLLDANLSTEFDKHYVYHTAWAARKLVETGVSHHVDISSFLYFSTICSAFVVTDFFDYRPAAIKLDNFISGAVDLCDMPFPDDSIASLSCMHVVEHIGLGRYGDPLDSMGDIKAINELIRVLSPGGNLLFVVPVGRKAKIMFNAHRIYTLDMVLSLFSRLNLVEFALIPDQSDEGLIVSASKEQVELQEYGCGCFWFRK